MNIPAFFLVLSLGLFAVTGQASAYDRAPTGSEISPPITSTFTHADWNELSAECATADTWNVWYQTSGYAEIMGSAHESATDTFSYEWSPVDATGSGDHWRMDCYENSAQNGTMQINDAFSWVEASTSTPPAESSTSTIAAIEEQTENIAAIGVVSLLAIGIFVGLILVRP